ncbi:hypothetical protein QYE76_022491 [Lolium multiflorum]|uniref:Uncharacterized protein n=1 Tax=Lolium multiflorum TaxID=4521 RepID=A0AAD8RBM0_LOLMU|nr:hypothetical protein QYE76_022491 [Lolium multiflorum]
MMTWADFKLKFSKYHVPPGLIKKMRDEFRELKQGRMFVVRGASRPGEDDTPWSREGEEQLDMEMNVKKDVELDPTSCKRAKEGREPAGPGPGPTGPLTGLPGPNRALR